MLLRRLHPDLLRRNPLDMRFWDYLLFSWFLPSNGVMCIFFPDTVDPAVFFILSNFLFSTHPAGCREKYLLRFHYLDACQNVHELHCQLLRILYQ